MAMHNGTGMQAVLTDDPDFLRDLVGQVIQEMLEAEMTAHLGATPYERTESRTGQRNGYRPRQLQTRVGTLTLLVPQDRAGTFSTQVFARYQRTEKALVLSLMVDVPARRLDAESSSNHGSLVRDGILEEPGVAIGEYA